jgi:hypothetical protein
MTKIMGREDMRNAETATSFSYQWSPVSSAVSARISTVDAHAHFSEISSASASNVASSQPNYGSLGAPKPRE